MLAPLGNLERSTIASVYSDSRAAIATAWANLWVVLQAASETVQAQVDGRSALAGFFACQATQATSGPYLSNALRVAMLAIVAKEAGLVLDGFPGTRLSTADYETLTQPIDQVLALPSGY